jgi:tRNA(Ile)-lysidine synthetase-like protein
LPYKQVVSIVERLVKGGSDGERMVLADTTLEFETERLVWSNGLPALAEGYLSFVYSDQVELDGSHQLILGGAPISSVPVEKRARIDGATLAPPVVVRSYREGDTISLVEGTKKVGSLFSDWHIRRSQRWRIPVVEDTVGVCAVLGGAFGGSDRVATRCLGTALARNGGTLYSVVELEG